MRLLASSPISAVASCVAGAAYEVPCPNGHPPRGTQPSAASALDSVAVIAPWSQVLRTVKGYRRPPCYVLDLPVVYIPRSGLRLPAALAYLTGVNNWPVKRTPLAWTFSLAFRNR